MRILTVLNNKYPDADKRRPVRIRSDPDSEHRFLTFAINKSKAGCWYIPNYFLKLLPVYFHANLCGGAPEDKGSSFCFVQPLKVPAGGQLLTQQSEIKEGKNCPLFTDPTRLEEPNEGEKKEKFPRNVQIKNQVFRNR